jgi:hypothetical protein
LDFENSDENDTDDLKFSASFGRGASSRARQPRQPGSFSTQRQNFPPVPSGNKFDDNDVAEEVSFHFRHSLKVTEDDISPRLSNDEAESFVRTCPESVPKLRQQQPRGSVEAGGFNSGPTSNPVRRTPGDAVTTVAGVGRAQLLRKLKENLPQS